MLYLIGIGLAEGDVSLKALGALKRCDAAYCEFYTSHWMGDVDKLGKLAGKKIEMLRRERVESEFLINEAKKKSVALLVPGDPLTATTHMQLLLDAKKALVDTEVIHSSSIYTAIAETGLQLYKFGRATTLAMPQKNFFPESPYGVIAENKKMGLHTLVLLDIPMDAGKGAEVLIELEKRKGEGIAVGRVIACSKLGDKDRTIKYCDISDLLNARMDSPAVIVVPGKLNFKEEEALELWK